MTQVTMEELQHALDRLEDARRRVTRVAGLVLFGVLAVVLMGQARPGKAPVVEAERFVLRDPSGHARGEFALLADGSVVLVLSDARGQVRLALSVATGGDAGLSFRDKAGRTRAFIRIAGDGPAGLTFQDPEGKVLWTAP